MGRLLNYAYYRYPMDFLQKLRKSIEAVTKEDIIRVAKQYLKPDQVQILAVGKPDDFDESLSVLGKVNEIDITIPTPEEEVPEVTGESISAGKDLFHKMVKASGGATSFKALRSYQWKGEKNVVTPQGELVLTADVVIAMPDRMRVNMTMPMGEVSYIYDKGKAWMVSAGNAIPAPETLKSELKTSFWRDLVFLFSMMDHADLSVQYIGPDKVNGESCEVLMFAPKDIKSFKIYVSSKTSLPLKMAYVGPTMTGAPAQTEELFYDFKTVEGMKIPFKVVMNQDGKKAQEILTKEILFNIEVDESQFDAEKEEQEEE
jgi:hypothetical protein